MSVHEGIDGVTRKNIHLLLGRSGIRRQAYLGFAGIDGIARQFLDVLDAIDHIEIPIDNGDIQVYSISNENDEYIGTGIDVASNYGAISVTADTITVRCTSRGYKIEVNPYGYIAFKTGIKLRIDYLTRNSFITSFLISVSVYLRFDLGGGEGAYWDDIFGTPPLSGYHTDYASATTNITPTNRKSYIASGIKWGDGANLTTVTFNSCTINGRTIPIRLINNFS